jgi:hypothetical protein
VSRALGSLRVRDRARASLPAKARGKDDELAGAGTLGQECRPDREGLEQRQPALLAARNDEGGDAHALELTTEEAVARLQAHWQADAAAYDKVHRHILHMSDMLSDGIVKQFASRFH